ncbi:isocitrate lyase/PEP mutase family protein [Pseudomonas mohnii]
MHNASHHELRNAFHALLAGSSCHHTASVFDPLSARMAADLGFEVGILGGSVASLQVLGAPDITLITLSEFAEQATRIGRVARLPVIADADHGYGNALNTMRTVVELERAGVAALTLEDTALPARYNCNPSDLISIEEGMGKLRAALRARQDPSLAIIARTHAGMQPLADVVARVRAYEDAGADAICLVGVKDGEILHAIAENVCVPLMLVTYGNPALSDDHLLAELGVRIVVDGHAPYFAAIKATYERLRKQRGLGVKEHLDATRLAAHYAGAETYVDWARDYMNVSE